MYDFMNHLKKYFMKRIDSAEKLKDLGQRVLNNNLKYKIMHEDDDYVIEIFRDDIKIYEFVCTKELGRLFLDEAVQF